ASDTETLAMVSPSQASDTETLALVPPARLPIPRLSQCPIIGVPSQASDTETLAMPDHWCPQDFPACTVKQSPADTISWCPRLEGSAKSGLPFAFSGAVPQ